MRKLALQSIIVILAMIGMIHTAQAQQDLSDEFLRGYVSAIVERRFPIMDFDVRVNRGNVTLYFNEDIIEEDILKRRLKQNPSVENIHIKIGEALTGPSNSLNEAQRDNMLLPEDKIFTPLIADLKWPRFATSLHLYQDDAEVDVVGAVALGETLPLIRWKTEGEWIWQLGLQGGIFAIFDLESATNDLINTDFYASIPLSFRKGSWSGIFRLEHQSSHLGDEYLLRNRVERINLSYETLDAVLSYEFLDEWRVYGGGGYIVHTATDLKRGEAQYGMEWRQKGNPLKNFLTPFVGLDLQQIQETQWDLDVSFKAGFSLHSRQARSYIWKVFYQYYNGHSPNGQFFNRTIEYHGLGLQVDF